MMAFFTFTNPPLLPEAEKLREEVRSFLAEELKHVPPHVRAASWNGFDANFSRKMGERGWIGMTWPKQYGGHERSSLERYVVLEEMLAAGAPVAAHWIADRQSGPLLLKFGTEEQRRAALPKIAAGELFCCIGMSEPDSGSDLASIRTRASKVDGGYLVNGAKIWTSNAHHCHWMIALFRTAGTPADRHEGLTQFLVPTDSKGMTIRPIRNLVGEEHFNEVSFQDVFVPDDMAVGEVGAGWKQVVAELAYERSGPERYLSSYVLIEELIRRLGREPSDAGAAAVGRIVAHLSTLRRMSLSVAGQLQAGRDPANEAAVVKDLGALLEQEIPEIAQNLVDAEPTLDGGDDFQQTLAYVTQAAPSFSLRGGTREILRGIIARGLGLR
jgi:alkylation response protein AidB-like acyl-CoA dehydrogenase